MKKSTKLIVALLVVVAALAVTYRLMHRVPSADLEANAQMQQIITDAGCLRCHTSTPDLPFYASMPVAGKIVMEDVSKAYRAFDMTQMEADLEAGQPLNPADLAKIEKVILDGKMPQAKYYLVHWGASFNDAKKEVALNWVKSHRMGMYTDITVAPEFANEPIRPIADSIAVDVRKVVLGNLLYHDTRLSADNTVSCASCHGLDTGGVDNKQYSEGVGGQFGGVNAPTVYNAAYNFVQFWDGRAETLADRIVPFSFIGFFATLIFTKNITRAVSLLMVDYSCAIKLSTPIAVISAVKEAADNDITIKGGKYLEAFANADTIVFDKTGTLTNAEPVLEKVVAFGDYTEDEVLRISACLEEHFPHSVANAVVIGAEKRGISHSEEHTEVEYVVAHGIATTLHGKRAIIGSKHFVVEDENVTVTKEQQNIIDEKSGSCSVLYLAIGGELSGALCISDPPRKEAKQAIDMLKKQGIKNVVMLTGDSYRAAKATAAMLGITDYKCQVLPEDKHRYVEEMKQNGQKVIMVGDGINDTPALAAANVSVAMNDASDIARETADITIKGSDLRALVRVRKLSKDLMKRINKNYRFIIAFNSALLLSGFMGVIQPSVSAFLHNASTMMICAKSMTPLTKKNDKGKALSLPEKAEQ